MDKPVWFLDEAIDLVRELDPSVMAYGWHCTLAGSVLYEGSSASDLDLLFFPHKVGGGATRNGLHTALTRFGLERYQTTNQVRAWWAKQGSTDAKHVEVYRDKRPGKKERRIDVFSFVG
jgi:hypothetical protein